MISPEAKIILKADDYGNAEAANYGINELVRRGLLSNVGVMIAFAGPKEKEELEAAIAASPLKDTVGIVLHTNFQSGRPVSPAESVPSLVQPDGRFKKPAPVHKAWLEYAASIRPDDAKRELDAQIERFHRLFGRYPDALDSHNVILATPPLDEMAMRIAQELGIGITYPYVYAEQYGSGALAAQELRVDLQLDYKRRGIPTADHAFPTYVNGEPDFNTSVNKMEDILSSLQPGVTQVVFHPVHPDTQRFPRIPSDTEPIDEARRRDFLVLTHPPIEHIIVDLRRNHQITSYKELNTK